ncbi:MAG TPA: HAD family phosphatase [Planctomycetaceae bacterium]|jgi:HAD superfamily hydrolase (TIGR01509 family)|nr:HAD family phosphatase [Planctomycetaceae bacterium]
MALPTIKAVVFDFDGLMFNTEEIFNLSGKELLRRRGKEMTPGILSMMMGRRSDEAFPMMIEALGLTEDPAALRAEERAIFHDLLWKHVAPMPGLFELLTHIEARGLPKGVATSSRRPYIESLLAHFKLIDRFHVTLTAEDVTRGKPHPEIYLTAAARIGVAPAEMLVLEDSEMGTRSAAAAGAVAVSVPHEHSRSQDFSTAYDIATGLHDPKILRLLA